MFDIRALLIGRRLEVGDGVYFERTDPKDSPLEGTLREWFSYLKPRAKGKAQRFLQQVHALEAGISPLNDQALKQALWCVGQTMHKTGFSDASMAHSFALIREGSWRILHMRHHNVQLLAGRALLQGTIAEMATGEGKTLVATLAACAAAVSGAAVHVVTVNDYLATRDAEHNAPLFEFFGLSLGIVKQDMAVPDRMAQYKCNITYVSNKELTFDYLKDRIAIGSLQHVHQQIKVVEQGPSAVDSILQGLHVAIVDEVDSVLIDEARTPLIISETLPDDLGQDVYQQGLQIARLLQKNHDFEQSNQRDLWLTDAGLHVVKNQAQDLGGVWQSALWRKELVEKALSALYAFYRDEHYIVVENKVQIVDEFTGRVMPDRTWERGLHQMIEAKEGCDITGQRKTLSQITYQRFFRRYLLLAGMTGTANEVRPELKRVYDLAVTHIPTHKPSKRLRMPDQVFLTPQTRWQVVAQRAQAVAAQGRSVLVGTRSVEASETISNLLSAQSVAHMVLNARQDKTEAQDIAQAGLAGRIVVATNMAGRGTDIKLSNEVREKGGLHVILTEFHESARIDRQLMGRAARQGDPGTTEAIVCLQDDLFKRYAPFLSSRFAPLFIGQSGVKRTLFSALVKHAQTTAERYNRRIRIATVKNDRKWLQALGFVNSTKK